jgi:hypothetical protein
MLSGAFFSLTLCIWLASLAWLSLNEPDRLLLFGRVFVATVTGLSHLIY